MATRAFLPQEMALALFFTAAVEVGLVGLLVLAGQNRVKVVAHEDTLKEEVPIAVKPVMDDLPLLKLGSKKVKGQAAGHVDQASASAALHGDQRSFGEGRENAGSHPDHAARQSRRRAPTTRRRARQRGGSTPDRRRTQAGGEPTHRGRGRRRERRHGDRPTQGARGQPVSRQVAGLVSSALPSAGEPTVRCRAWPERLGFDLGGSPIARSPLRPSAARATTPTSMHASKRRSTISLDSNCRRHRRSTPT